MKKLDFLRTLALLPALCLVLQCVSPAAGAAEISGLPEQTISEYETSEGTVPKSETAEDEAAVTEAGTVAAGAENEGGQSRLIEDLSPSIETVLSGVRSWIIRNDTNPGFESIWFALDLARSSEGIPASYAETFYKNIVSYYSGKNWIITKNRYSDYSKTIMALTAAGYNCRNIEGHDLLAYLSDFDLVKKQGLMGPLWALIALNCHDGYSIPENPIAGTQNTDRLMVDYLLEKALPTGGWGLMGKTADVDVTAMTVQALTPYYDSNEKVKAAVDAAVDWLAQDQYEDGGFGTLAGKGKTETSESTAQVIVALSGLGIDCGSDARFIKNGNWPLSALLSYYIKDGGFAHLSVSDGINGLATYEGYYAVISYERYLSGKTSLYDMNDVKLPTIQTAQTDYTLITPEASGKGSSGESGNTSQNNSANSSSASSGNSSGSSSQQAGKETTKSSSGKTSGKSSAKKSKKSSKKKKSSKSSGKKKKKSKKSRKKSSSKKKSKKASKTSDTASYTAYPWSDSQILASSGNSYNAENGTDDSDDSDNLYADEDTADEENEAAVDEGAEQEGAEGWSFDGADYVPDSSMEAADSETEYETGISRTQDKSSTHAENLSALAEFACKYPALIFIISGALIAAAIWLVKRNMPE